jgi:ABC-type transporter Mla maintaining outer membrane lipid asymmetry ATPase subunit MlaF
MTAVLELDGVVTEFQDQPARSNLSLSIQAGEFVVALGPSRSGKSLLLELCAGLMVPNEGYVRALGQRWNELAEEETLLLRLRIGTVLQKPGLLSNMTLFDNVALPLRYHNPGLSAADIERRVMGQLQPLGIWNLRQHFPSQLNPGEIRCGAIARALVLQPELLLLDDPVEGLDAAFVDRLARHLLALRERQSLTVFGTLRAWSPVVESADRILWIEEGRIGWQGPRGEFEKTVGQRIWKTVNRREGGNPEAMR